jgi:CRISPR-associated protein Cas1
LRKMLNTLYITSRDAYLAREGENIVVRIQEDDQFRIPIHNIEGIVTFGYTGASPGLMGLCVERGVYLSFISNSGRLLARVGSSTRGNVWLRKKQYQLADSDEECLNIARNFVLGKLHNSRTVLQRFLRDHSETEGNESINRAIRSLSNSVHQCLKAESLEKLRGIEGMGARTYYAVFDNLILHNKQVFKFNGRSRRPPLDPVNAVLSFLYTLLTHEAASAADSVGLDPQVGFLHRIRSGRYSLALDLVEELRSYLVDRVTLALVNNRQLDEQDFVFKESGAVLLNDEGRKKVINVWQTRKQQEVQHPFLNETIEVGLIPYVQAMLLARYITGDIDGYPPYLIR